MSSVPNPPVFRLPPALHLRAEIKVAVDSSPLENLEFHGEISEEALSHITITRGPWRFRTTGDHLVHHVRIVRLGFQVALESVIWRSALYPPFRPNNPNFLGYLSNPPSTFYPMRTFVVLRTAEHNYALVPLHFGPLLNHNQRLRYTVSREYGYSLTAAVRRWADEFGLWIDPRFDAPVDEAPADVMDVVSEDKGLDDSRDYGPEFFPPSPDFTVTYDGPEVAINSEVNGDIAATSD